MTLCKKIKIVDGDGSTLDISPVYNHIKDVIPKKKNTKKDIINKVQEISISKKDNTVLIENEFNKFKICDIAKELYDAIINWLWGNMLREILNRCKKIILKEKAKKMFDMKRMEFYKMEEVIKKGLSEEEIEIFCHIIESMQNNINEYANRRKD